MTTKPFGLEKHGFWIEVVDDVEIDREPMPITGWAVLTENEGAPDFHAFCPSRELAEQVLLATSPDGERLIGNCEASVQPAVILGDRMNCTGFYWANAGDEESVAALAKRFGIDPGAWK